MPRKKQQTMVTLVGVRGAKLPVETGVLIDVTDNDFVLQGAVKVGRGRGQKTMLRTYTLPKHLVAYHYSEVEIDAEDAPVAPVAASAPVARAPKEKAAKKKKPAARRGRPPKDKGAEDPKPAAKKRGRPKKAAAAKKPAAKKTAAPKPATNKAAAPKKPAAKKPAAGRANALFEEDF